MTRRERFLVELAAWIAEYEQTRVLTAVAEGDIPQAFAAYQVMLYATRLLVAHEAMSDEEYARRYPPRWSLARLWWRLGRGPSVAPPLSSVDAAHARIMARCRDEDRLLSGSEAAQLARWFAA